MGRMEIFTGRERRRSWSDEEKLRILEEAAEPSVSAASVARRHDLHPQQIYAWRRQYGGPVAVCDEAMTFLPVSLVDGQPYALENNPEPTPRRKRSSPERIEIVCCNGRVLKIDAGVDVDRLGALIRAVEAA